MRSRDLVDRALSVVVNELVRGRAPWPLTLVGDAGAGKTCVSLCVLDRFGGMYRRFPDLCQELADAKCARLFNDAGYKVGVCQVWDGWLNANLAVLDEIGCRGTASDHVYDVLLTALDSRQEMPLVCVTNLTVEEIANVFDDRIASRLCAGTVRKLLGDRRRNV